MLLVAGAAYLACLWVQDRWLVMGLLALMAVAVDVGMPAIWAFSQDVGGRHTGAVLGWGNMFGNLGAGLSPLLLGRVKEHWGWDGVFLTCAGCFAVAAAAALNLDATRPVFKDTAGAQNAPPPA
jgi:ACS family glucarate transporter-like MFS transporter